MIWSFCKIELPALPGYDDDGYDDGLLYEGEPGNPGVPGWSK